MTVVSKNPNYYTPDLEASSLANLKTRIIPCEKLKLLDEIGEGAFGKVYKGMKWETGLFEKCMSWSIFGLSFVVGRGPSICGGDRNFLGGLRGDQYFSLSKRGHQIFFHCVKWGTRIFLRLPPNHKWTAPLLIKNYSFYRMLYQSTD